MQRKINSAILLVLALVAAGCQATSDAGNYHPANCAMVGSSCSRSHH